MTDRNQWLKDLGNQSELWAEHTDDIPAMLRFSYGLIQRFAKEGQVYGIMLQCKDLFESLMKVPVLMALIIADSYEDHAEQQAYSDLLKKLLASPMNMGLWNEEAALLVRHGAELHVPETILTILKKTRRLYALPLGKESTDVVNWRNNTIGHGALRYEDDSSYQQEVKTILEMLKEYFDGNKKYSLKGLYENVYFTLDGEKLCGSASLLWKEDSILKLSAEGLTYDASHYLFSHDLKGYLFETYFSRRQLLKYTSYTDGKSDTEMNAYFRQLYERYIRTENRRFEIDADFISRENEMILEYLHTASDYVIPEKLVESLEEILEEEGKGIISVFMERGTGKSAFASRMSGLYHKAPLISDAFSRCVHVQNVSVRGISDFINAMNFGFRHSYDASDDLYGSTSELASLSLETETPSEDMAEFLNYYHEQYRKEYTVLLIDGIDELSQQTERILDYVPSSALLDEGVFVILLSRFKDENTVSENSKAYIEKAGQMACRRIEVRRKDEFNLEVLNEYTEKQINSGRIKTDTDRQLLFEKADYRILYLKALTAVGHEVSFDNLSETRFVESFLEYVLSFYGPVQAQKLIEIAVSAALFPGLTVKKYCDLIDCSAFTCEMAGYFNDLLPLMSVYRMDDEDVIQFADSAYREYVLNRYETELKETVKKLNQSIAVKTSFWFEGHESVELWGGVHVTEQDSKDLVFFAEGTLAMFQRSLTQPDDILFYEITEIMPLITALKFCTGRSNVQGSYLSKELTDCIVKGLKRYASQDQNDAVVKWGRTVCKAFTDSSMDMSPSEEIAFRMRISGALDEVYRILIDDRSERDDISEWFWLLKNYDDEETAQYIAANEKRQIAFADHLNEYGGYFIDRFIRTLLSFDLCQEAEEKLYNFLLRYWIPPHIQYLASRPREEIRNVRNIMEQKGYQIDRASLSPFGCLVVDHIYTDDLNDAVFRHMESKLLDALGECKEHAWEDKQLIASLEAIFEFIHDAEFEDKSNLPDLREVYGALYERIVHEVQYDSFPLFMNSAKELFEYFPRILESVSENDMIRYQELLNDWIGIVRSYALEKDQRFAVLEANLRVRQVQAFEKEGYLLEAQKQLEDLVLLADTPAYIASVFGDDYPEIQLHNGQSENPVFCTSNSLVLLDSYYENGMKEPFEILADRIENSAKEIVDLFADLPEKQLQAEGMIFTFMKYRYEYGRENSFDAYVASILKEHEDRLTALRENITGDGDLNEISVQAEVLLEYYWRSERWNACLKKCEELISFLSPDAQEHNPAVKDGLETICFRLNSVHNFLLYITDRPYKVSDSIQDWLAHGGFHSTVFGASGLFDMTDHFEIMLGQGEKTEFLIPPLSLSEHHMP